MEIARALLARRASSDHGRADRGARPAARWSGCSGSSRELRRDGHRDPLHQPPARRGRARSPTASRSCATARRSGPGRRAISPATDDRADGRPAARRQSSRRGRGRLGDGGPARRGPPRRTDPRRASRSRCARGEVLGLAGLVGAGPHRPGAAGLRRRPGRRAGRSSSTAGRSHPLARATRSAHGICLLTEDRKGQGLRPRPLGARELRAAQPRPLVAPRLDRRRTETSAFPALRRRASGSGWRGRSSRPQPLGRQPAEAADRPLARARCARDPLRRADARHRRRRQARNLSADPRPGGAGQGDRDDLLGTARDPRHERPHPGDARGRVTGEITRCGRRDAGATARAWRSHERRLARERGVATARHRLACSAPYGMLGVLAPARRPLLAPDRARAAPDGRRGGARRGAHGSASAARRAPSASSRGPARRTRRFAQRIAATASRAHGTPVVGTVDRGSRRT